MSTQQHVNQLVPKHATQLTKTSVPVAGTVSHRNDPEQTELEEDSIPRPATRDANIARCTQFRIIVVTDPHRSPVANPQTGPITIHCAAMLSAQCN